MAINPGDVFQTQIVGKCFGQIIRHVRTWYADTVSAAVPNDLAFCDAFLLDTKLGAAHDKVTPYLNCIASNYICLYYQVQKVSPYRWAKRVVEFPAGTVGLDGTTTTANVGGAITVSSALAGRKYVGSYKIGPMATSRSIDGELSAGGYTRLADYCTDIVLPLGIVIGGATVVMQPAIFHAGTKTPFVPSTADIILHAQPRLETRVKSTRNVRKGE